MSLTASLSSGALKLELASSGTLCANGCERTGRYEIHIAGYVVRGTNGVERYAYLCSPCAKEMVRAWDEFAGRAAVEDEAVAA